MIATFQTSQSGAKPYVDWRRGGDSNPRYLAVSLISSHRTLSNTRATRRAYRIPQLLKNCAPITAVTRDCSPFCGTGSTPLLIVFSGSA